MRIHHLNYGTHCPFCLCARHASEQYLTSSQTFAHFLRQTNGRLQVAQVLTGKSRFSMRFAIVTTTINASGPPDASQGACIALAELYWRFPMQGSLRFPCLTWTDELKRILSANETKLPVSG